jgi:hypothetical protein
MQIRKSVFISLISILITQPSFAHHGFAQYFDRAKQVRIEGTVHAISIRNPHAHLEVAVVSESGETEIWSCETQAKTLLDRKGISESDFVIGEDIVVTGSQARHNLAGCEIGTLYFSDGESITFRTDTGRAVIAVTAESDASLERRQSIFGRWVRNGFSGNPTEAGFLEVINEAGQAASAEYNSFQDDPSLHCMSSTPVRVWIAPGNPSEIRQEGDRIIMQHEFMDTTRTIYLDAATAPNNLPPSDIGSSIGRFEGNELIVETDNFTEGVLLSHVGEGSGGIVHSDALKLIERYRVDADGNLAFSWEATDSNYFSGPIRGGVVLSPTALDLDEYNCEKAIQD